MEHISKYLQKHNRVVTGHWDGEEITREKNFAERWQERETREIQINQDNER